MARILITEDEPKLARYLSRALSLCGFDVVSVSSGERAIELQKTESFDLLLLDLLLPNLDGFAVLERTMELRPTQEVIVLSALSDVESKVRCFELGAGDYVTKPFAIAELVARIRSRIRHAGDQTTRYLENGEVRLDLRRRIAITNGKSVQLSSREFLLLEYLMRKDGEVCGRAELLASVWGFTFDPGTNVVDVYIGRLRSKLGKELIETIRNVGYTYTTAVLAERDP